MKKQLVTLCMFLILSVVTSTLFAQATERVDIEGKLAENGKSWIWYSADPKPATDRNETFTFDKATHKVSIRSAGSTTMKKWSIATTTGDGQTKLTIGAESYVLTFGSDKTHAEFISLKSGKPVTTNNYYSVVTR